MCQNSITIQGKLAKHNGPAKVYLSYPDTSGIIFKITDSTSIINGQFSFILKNDLPPKVFLTVHRRSLNPLQQAEPDQLPVYLIFSNTSIQVLSNTDHIKEAVVIGSKNNSDYTSYLNLLKPLEKESQKLLTKFKMRGPNAIKDTTFMKDLRTQRDAQNKEFLDLALQFIRTNHDSYIALEILQSSLMQGLIDYRMAESELDKFSAELKTTKLGKQISKTITNSKIEPRGDGPRAGNR
ncbi:hypothetical protein TH53_02170 [Pedobacter lusitanus]|uniref:DUF4369 domain-containing protein n=2 Tax=Pedobacter lusitanus TaxID=1503925 RepID=A0A0D0G1P2_9SPHI|nr:hypothetical protein TH53_02170 [Pedobacter lusitanus]